MLLDDDLLAGLVDCANVNDDPANNQDVAHNSQNKSQRQEFPIRKIILLAVENQKNYRRNPNKNQEESVECTKTEIKVVISRNKVQLYQQKYGFDDQDGADEVGAANVRKRPTARHLHLIIILQVLWLLFLASHHHFFHFLVLVWVRSHVFIFIDL